MDTLEDFLREEQEEIKELIPGNSKMAVIMDKKVDKLAYQVIED
jgi:hypothetical protein